MAAGQGFKTFTTGEVLTAGDVNGYLMQGINVFASEAARDAAITAPAEGQFAFTKDNNSLWYYTGSAWAASGATGDIEGVTAGVGISGGGTSGTVTITNDMATTITASGDIVVGTGSGTYDNLPIGTTNQVLTADTTVSPYKVKWATPASGGGMTLISTTTLSGASVTLSSIPSGYVNLVLTIKKATNSTANGFIAVEPNALGATGYNWGTGVFNGTLQNNASARVQTPTTVRRSNDANAMTFTWYNHEQNDWTAYSIFGGYLEDAVSDYRGFTMGGYSYIPTSAITSLKILNTGGNWAGGTAYLYGVK